MSRRFGNAVLIAAGICGFAAVAAARADCTCPGDVNGDADVDLGDLSQLLAHFGTTGGASRADGDLNGDQDVDLDDLTELLSHFGTSCCPSPDLRIEELELLAPALCLNGSSTIRMRLCNRGLGAAHGEVTVGTWLNLDCNPFSGNDDIPLGAPPITLPTLGLRCDECMPVQFETNTIPQNAQVGTQQLNAFADLGSLPCGRICECSEDNNLTCVPVQVDGPDGAIIDLQYPPIVVGNTLVDVTVTVANTGCWFLDIPFRLSIGSNHTDCWANNMSPAEVRNLVCTVLAPSRPCGAEPFPISACTTLGFDVRHQNNCWNGTIRQRYWDIHLTIENAPSQVPSCPSPAHTPVVTVRVHNAGNQNCSQIPFFIGLCTCGCDCSGQCANGPQPHTAFNVQPGIDQLLSFPYPYCGAFCPQTQHWGVWTTQDACGDGNCDSQQVFVFCGN